VERQVHLQEAKMRCSIGKDRDQHRICLELLQSIQKQARLASRTSSLERP
jgi:hypothetical protein